MATTAQNVSAFEFLRQVHNECLGNVYGLRRGRATAEKFKKAIENCAATDPDLGSDWLTQALQELDDNIRVGSYSRDLFDKILDTALAAAGVVGPTANGVTVTTPGAVALPDGYHTVTAFTTSGAGTGGTATVLIKDGAVADAGFVGGSSYVATNTITLTAIAGVTPGTNPVLTVG